MRPYPADVIPQNSHACNLRSQTSTMSSVSLLPVSPHTTMLDMMDRVARMESVIATMAEQQTQVARMESALATMAEKQSLAAAIQNTQCNVLHEVQESVKSVALAQRQMYMMMVSPASEESSPVIDAHGTHSTTTAVHGSPQSSTSPESVKLCAFPDCNVASPKSCSSTKSLRHMQVCVFCPAGDSRILHISKHMLHFQQHPRVTDVNVCCWCNGLWHSSVSPDSRSRHRRACHQRAIIALQDPNKCGQMALDLTAAWSNSCMSPTKRARESVPNTPPSSSAAFSPPCGASTVSGLNYAEVDDNHEAEVFFSAFPHVSFINDADHDS